MSSYSERFLMTDGADNPGEGWKAEATHVIKDVSSCVSSICISEKLPSSETGIYFNLETKEMLKYTIELSTAGFRICGNAFDSNHVSDSKSFETIYALLDSISPKYRESFGQALSDRLTALLPDPNDSS